MNNQTYFNKITSSSREYERQNQEKVVTLRVVLSPSKQLDILQEVKIK